MERVRGPEAADEGDNGCDFSDKSVEIAPDGEEGQNKNGRCIKDVLPHGSSKRKNCFSIPKGRRGNNTRRSGHTGILSVKNEPEEGLRAALGISVRESHSIRVNLMPERACLRTFFSLKI